MNGSDEKIIHFPRYPEDQAETRDTLQDEAVNSETAIPINLTALNFNTLLSQQERYRVASGQNVASPFTAAV